MKFGGDEPVIQEVMYKKKKKNKEETDAVSYYKPHPHLKCPHMISAIALFFLFLVYSRKGLIIYLLHLLSHHHHHHILSLCNIFSCSFEKSKQKVLQK